MHLLNSIKHFIHYLTIALITFVPSLVYAQDKLIQASTTMTSTLNEWYYYLYVFFFLIVLFGFVITRKLPLLIIAIVMVIIYFIF